MLSKENTVRIYVSLDYDRVFYLVGNNNICSFCGIDTFHPVPEDLAFLGLPLLLFRPLVQLLLGVLSNPEVPPDPPCQACPCLRVHPEDH